MRGGCVRFEFRDDVEAIDRNVVVAEPFIVRMMFPDLSEYL